MITTFFTKEQKWFDQWDNYLQTSERGLYNQYSNWIKAYDVYGFESVLYLITHNDEIVGGCGIVIAKAAFFKFLIVPCGPVIEMEFENQIDTTIQNIKAFAQKSNCCYFQINLPIIVEEKSFHNYTISKISSDSLFYKGNEGTKFKYVIPLFGMRLIDLYQKSVEEVIQKFSSNHKRNLKKSASYDFEFTFVDSEKDVAEAYQCFVLNAQSKGYPLRSYDSIKQTLLNYIDKNQAKIAVCKYQNKVVGALYVMICGNRMIYINGGVLKEFQDLPISVFMHHKIILHSIDNQYKSYDISVGGSAGVIRFKEGFGSELFTFENSRHWILKPAYFSIYVFFEKRLKPYKQSIAKVLFYIKKIFK